MAASSSWIVQRHAEYGFDVRHGRRARDSPRRPFSSHHSLVLPGREPPARSRSWASRRLAVRKTMTHPSTRSLLPFC